MKKVRVSVTALSTTQGLSAADTSPPAKDTHVLNSPVFRPLVLAVVAAQVLWALIIPIKNVVIIPFPKFRSDELSTLTQAYSGYNPLLNVTYSGQEVLQVLRDVLAISLSNPQVRSIFEQKADFAIDELGQVLSTHDHATLTKYYTLVFQSSEFPGGRFTVRSEKIAVVQPNGSKLYYTIGCPESQTLLSGTTCVDSTGLPCDDIAWGAPNPPKLDKVDFAPFWNDTGWQNSIGLLGLVEYFHYYMRMVFAKQNWAVVVASGNLDMGYAHLTDDADQLLVESPIIALFATQSDRNVALNSTIVWNCLATETMLGEAYLANFTLGMIQTALLEQNLYNATQAVNVTKVIEDRAMVVLGGHIRITSGAGFAGFRNTTKALGGTKMTHTAISSVNLKRDRPMTGPQIIGGSMRNLIYMGYFPNSYYSVLERRQNGTEHTFVSSVLGGMHGGYNGFKFDFIHNTMTALKLAERAPASGTGYAHDWFAQEEAIASWYAAYESRRGTGSLIDLAVNRLGGLSSPSLELACYQALFKRIAQASWLLLLQGHPITEHLVFQSVYGQGEPALYFFKQMLKNEIAVENTYGYRVPLQFNPTNTSTNLGTAWPMVPILSALVARHGAAAVRAGLLAVLNATFLQLVDFGPSGFHFHDVNSCPIGGISPADTPTTAYNKLFPGLDNLVADTVAAAEPLRRAMEQELKQEIQVRQEYVNDTRVHSMFKNLGPPVCWTHSALGLGLARLSCKVSPSDDVVELVKDARVCYDVLETRYLNKTSRCFSEVLNVNETRAQYNSEGLRTLLLGTWSMGVVVNIFAAGIALRFAMRVVRGARLTKLQEDWRTLVYIDIEEFGLISFPECVLMACSTVPFLFSYQLPQDSEYVANPTSSHLGSVYLDELFVTMGITWFIRVGMDVGSACLHLRHRNVWFVQQSFSIRAALIVAVYVVRIATSTPGRDYNRAFWSLVLSCLLSAAAGMVSMLASACFDGAPAPSSVEDPISHALWRAGVARNRHCIFGQQGQQWSHMGLILEGWTCAQDKGKVVFKNHAGTLLFEVRETGGFKVQKLHAINEALFQSLATCASNPVTFSKVRPMKSKSSVTDIGGPCPSEVPGMPTQRNPLSIRMILTWGAVFIQAAWALAVPARNVLLFPYPTYSYDNTTTSIATYRGHDPSVAPLTFTGPEVFDVVQKALAITVSNAEVRRIFELAGHFAIDALGQVLDPVDHQVFAKLYALAYQASEFPAGKMTPRQVQLVRLNLDGSTARKYTVGCHESQSTLLGATCVDAVGAPCTTVQSTTSVTNVDTLADLAGTSGWDNAVALVSFVEYFMRYMHLVFDTQDWDEVAAAAADQGLGVSGLVAQDGAIVETPSVRQLLGTNTNASTVWNCLATEVLVSEVFVGTFVLNLVQNALAEARLYNAAPPALLESSIQTQALSVLNGSSFLISSGAGYLSFTEATKTLFTKPMTFMSISKTVLKRDFNLGSTIDSTGSSVRHLITLASDVTGAFSLRRETVHPEDNSTVVETRVLGGLLGGYRGFKDAPVRNTMGVYKLSERRTTKPDADELSYFAKEASVARWYVKYENQKGTGNLVSNVVRRLGTIRFDYTKKLKVPVTNDAYETMCYQALMRRVSQMTWLAALRLHPVLQHLVFMSAQDDVTDHDWFLHQMMANEVIGEDAFGNRVPFPYVVLFTTSNLGNGWPVLSILHALNQVHNASFLQQEIMREFDANFVSMLESDSGLVNFRDATYCPIGHTKFGVTEDDDLPTIYSKVHHGLELVVKDTIDGVEAALLELEAATNASVRVPVEYLQDTRTIGDFAKLGPPIKWTHSPLGLGLLRLTTKEGPYPDSIKVLRDSMVCYNTLEARDLTKSYRCWSESKSVGETRASYSSVRLRVVLFSAWAIGTTLNALGEFIAVRYVLRLCRMWWHTRFDLGSGDLGLLLSSHIQSLGGATSIPETAMLAFSSMALQFAYRMPQDPAFVVSTTSLRAAYFDEGVIALGMTWTVHLGMELGSAAIHLRHRNRWFVAQNTFFKGLLSAVVFALLVATRDSANYDDAIISLVGIWLFALAGGFMSMVSSSWFDGPRATVETDEVTAGLLKANLPRNHIGYLSQQRHRWSLVGVWLEGWRGVVTGPKTFLMACHNVLVHLSAGGSVEPITCKDISVADFALLAEATSRMTRPPSVLLPEPPQTSHGPTHPSAQCWR